MFEVSTQEELIAALAKKRSDICLVGDGIFEVDGSAQVTARGSAQVTAYGSAQVTACDSAQVTAYGSAQVTAYGSAQVTAYGSAQVTACGSAQVRAASALVAVTIHCNCAHCEGGTIIRVTPIKSVDEWLSRNGIEATDGRVVLYKAVNSKFQSNHNGFPYVPGSTPVAPDWDGGRRECGGGLHFSPTPGHALGFNPAATHFVACPVAITDMRCPQADDDYPEKIKASGCCAPVWEVDINGGRIGTVAGEP